MRQQPVGSRTTMEARQGYSATNGRRIRLQGTEGELHYDEATGRMITRRFDGEIAQCLDFPVSSSYHPEDDDIVRHWLHAISNPGDARIAVDAHEALGSHAIVFASERAGREARVVAQ